MKQNCHKSALEGLQTIAARVLKRSKDNEMLLEVLWLSQMEESGTQIGEGSLISRNVAVVLRLEKECGVYRLPWVDESARDTSGHLL